MTRRILSSVGLARSFSFFKAFSHCSNSSGSMPSAILLLHRVSATMNQKQISEVPNPGNDLTYIVQTAPGAVMNTDSSINTLGHFSILGMPGTSCHYTNDGMNELRYWQGNQGQDRREQTGSLTWNPRLRLVSESS